MARRAKLQPKDTGVSVRTFQMRLRGGFPGLDDLAERYQRGKRTSYGLSCRGNRPVSAFKESICAQFGLPARMFNAIEKNLGGMVRSIQEKAKFDLGETEDRVAVLSKDLDKLKRKLESKTSPLSRPSGARSWTRAPARRRSGSFRRRRARG